MNRRISEQSYVGFAQKILQQGQQGESPRPLSAQFEITYRCNIHCVHCYTDPFNTPRHLRRELPVDQILGLFDQLAEAGVFWMTLTGGEAFVHPEFKRIYREAKARGFIMILFSNATTLTEDLADFLAKDPPFKLEVSCHGATAETFERITQVPGSFRHFQDGVRRILERGLPLRIKTKGMTLNRDELPEIKTFVEGLGLPFRLYTTVYPRLDGDLSSTQYRLSPEEIVSLEYDGLEGFDEEEEGCETKETRAGAQKFPPPPDDRLFRCGCGTTGLTINPYGILRACTFTTWPEYDLKEMPFQEAFARMVHAIRQARYTGESPCGTCTAYTVCNKNPAAARFETGSMEAPVPHFCDVAFGRKAKQESFSV